MEMTREQIELEAMKLPMQERAELGERLLNSVQDKPEIEKIWVEEAERRLQELHSGRVTGIPGDEAMRRLRAGLRGQP